MNYEICVIGNEALLFPFLQFGFTTYAPATEAALREHLLEVIAEDYGIIYIEDSFCFSVRDIIDKYSTCLTPIFIPIGENEDGQSFAREMAVSLMERAIGQNVI